MKPANIYLFKVKTMSLTYFPGTIYLLNVNNRNTRKRCENVQS